MADAGERRGLDWRILVTLAVLMAIAAGFRFWEIGRSSVWLDEAVSWSQARFGLAHLFYKTAGDSYPPLHNLALWPVIKLFGDSEAALRAPSAVFSTLTIAATFFLGRSLAGPRAGLIAAALMVIVPVEIEQARTARMYTLFSLTTTLYLWSAVAYLRAPSERGAGLGGLAAFAMVFTHLYGTFVFIAVGVAWNFIYWIRKAMAPADYWRWTRAQAVAFLLYTPWFILLIGRAIRVVKHGFWVPDPTFDVVVRMAKELFPRYLALLVAAVLAAGAVTAVVRRSAFRGLDGGALLVVAAAAVGPFVIGYIASVLVEPILIPRYLIASIPATMVLVAAILVRLPVPAIAQWAVVALVCVMTIRPALSVMDSKWAWDWRGLVARYEEQRQPGDRIVVFPFYNQVPFTYYAGETDFAAKLEERAQLFQPLELDGRTWIAIAGLTDAERDKAIEAYRAAGYAVDPAFEARLMTLLLVTR